jgi:ABC-type lipoprotein export system ATPase subunit
VEDALGLPSGKMSETWNSLSGGQRQRAAVGCALILLSTVESSGTGSSTCDSEGGVSETDEGETGVRPRQKAHHPPAILLLDEPTAACDEGTSALVERAIIDSGLAVIMITHNSGQAERMAHKRLIMTLV